MKLQVAVEGHAFVVDAGAHEAILEDGTVATFEPTERPTGAASPRILRVGDRCHEVSVQPLPDGRLRVWVDGHVLDAEVRVKPPERVAAGTEQAVPSRVEAPMSGLVLRLLVADGDPVQAGQPLLVIEAMKMENVVRAPVSGRVHSLTARVGVIVQKAQALLVVDPC